MTLSAKHYRQQRDGNDTTFDLRNVTLVPWGKVNDLADNGAPALTGKHSSAAHEGLKYMSKFTDKSLR